MPRTDTTMGGNRDSFPETAWSSVLSDADPASPRRKAALNRLFALYWRPVYAFIRASWGKSVDEAKDLTQDFFCSILEGDSVARYQPAAGRFRHYLKGALRNFMAGMHRQGRALKRGGGEVVVSLDVGDLEKSVPAGDGATPEELFDRQWVRDVTDRALADLKERLIRDGRERHYRVYEEYELHPADSGRPTYEEVARRLGISVGDVRNFLHIAREELRTIVRLAVSEYVSSQDELVEEIVDLFSR